MPDSPSPPNLELVLSFLEDAGDPAVRESLAVALAPYEGDLSTEIPKLKKTLSPASLRVLSQILHTQRREKLAELWQIPTNPIEALSDDWDRFESLLRLLSDYLHDGLTPRRTLHDELDFLVAEIEDAHLFVDEELVLQHLFRSGRFHGNRRHYSDPRNNDLGYVIETTRGNSVSLGIVFLLVCARLGLDAYPTLHPGPFLVGIQGEHGPLLIDCFHNGKRISPEALAQSFPDLSREEMAQLSEPVPLVVVLYRLLTSLAEDFKRSDKKGGDFRKDILLLERLSETLIPQALA